jgi:hypothetical protein
MPVNASPAKSAAALVAVLLLCAGVLFFAVRTTGVISASDGATVQDGTADTAASDQIVPADSPYWSDPAGVGKPYPPGTVKGQITFRGNPTRTFYGTGPVPRTTPHRRHGAITSPVRKRVI